MNFSLGKTWESYVSEQVESGMFNNASEVVRDALRRQQEQLLKLEVLRRELATGVDSVKAGRTGKPSVEDIMERAKARNRGA
ncbi:MAG: type II toxin-antitoxin system ParD family antitoxin [Ahrensia sp.]|nr:type II toxin-antitoxin system ParD family antitoxin [Ahrensia sp.]